MNDFEITSVENVQVPEEMLEQWTDLLLKGIKFVAGDVVGVRGQPCTLPLLKVLIKKIVLGGGTYIPLLQMPDHGRLPWGQAMAFHGNPEMIAEEPQWRKDMFTSTTAYIEVLGDERLDLIRDWPEEMQAAINRANKQTVDIRLKKRWIITLWPTQAEAKSEGLDYLDYARLIVGASVTDSATMLSRMTSIKDAMDVVDSIIIVTRRFDGTCCLLEMDIPFKNVPCVGEYNHPDGELFTSPDARSVRGEVYLEHAISHEGKVVRGIWLKFDDDGCISDFSAQEGEDVLERIIETDDGSRRLGEVALGFNDGFGGQVLMHPLFVEKVAGTFHIAIGSSYDQCFGKEEELEAAKESGAHNESAKHVDLVGKPIEIRLFKDEKTFQIKPDSETGIFRLVD